MTTQLVAWGFLFILIATVVFVGWWQIREGGKRIEKLKEAKEDARDATKQVERRTNSVPSNLDYLERLRSAKKRLARLRDRKTK